MKPTVLFFFHLLLASFTTSFPTEQAELRLQRRFFGKHKAPNSPSPPPSAPGTPEPGAEAPLPGRSGVSTQQSPDGTNVHTAHYGDDHIPGHMNHVDRNQQMFPANRGSFPLSGGGNRPQALQGIAPAGPHPVTGEPQDRDEKLPNMLDVPNRQDRTTVENRPKSESRGKSMFRPIPINRLTLMIVPNRFGRRLVGKFARQNGRGRWARSSPN